MKHALLSVFWLVSSLGFAGDARDKGVEGTHEVAHHSQSPSCPELVKSEGMRGTFREALRWLTDASLSNLMAQALETPNEITLEGTSGKTRVLHLDNRNPIAFLFLSARVLEYVHTIQKAGKTAFPGFDQVALTFIEF